MSDKKITAAVAPRDRAVAAPCALDGGSYRPALTDGPDGPVSSATCCQADCEASPDLDSDEPNVVQIHTKQVLVVDSHPDTRASLAQSLARHGFDVFQAANVPEAQSLVRKYRPDIALIECSLREESGLGLLRMLKDDPRTTRIPVMVLTARSGEEDKIRGFEAGADDYVIKPFSADELMARVRAILRRVYRNEPSGVMRACGLIMNVVSKRVTFRDRSVGMTPLEFRLLSFLMAHPERVLTRSMILNRVWDAHVPRDVRAVDAQVSNLRQLLKDYECYRCIQTVYGIGYRFSTQPAH